MEPNQTGIKRLMQYVIMLTFENQELFLMDAYKDQVRIFERKDIADEIARELDGVVLEFQPSDPTEEN